MAKQRIALSNTRSEPLQSFVNTPAGAAIHSSVVAEKDGSVGWLDRLKGYYHTLIAVVSALLMFVNEVSDVVPQEYQHVVTVAIGIISATVTFLKHNETWVDSL